MIPVTENAPAIEIHSNGTVTIGGRRRELGPLRCRLLSVLMEKSPEYVHKKQMLAVGWGEDGWTAPGTLRVHITNLRHLVGEAGYMLQNDRKKGYRLLKRK